MKKVKCEICAKDSFTKEGWHFKNGYNFCSNKCVANFLERLPTKIVSGQSFCDDNHEKHILYESMGYRCIVKGCRCFNCGRAGKKHVKK